MTQQPFILEVDPSWRRGIEDMGSKPKFWFRYRDEMWLFKQARVNTGEHWAEKVASEIAELMGLPTHEALIATYEGNLGCAVRSFLKPGQTLVHGNELMAGAIEGYDKSKHRGQADHNFENIVATLERRFMPPVVRRNVSLRFIGYLMLDALVGNTDRHHENWGVVQKVTIKDNRETKQLRIALRIGLAPTFDHASSLGRELLDEARLRMLADPTALRRYIRKGTGGIFRDAEAKKGLAPIALAEIIAQSYPQFYEPWSKRIASLPVDFAKPLLDGIPDLYMSHAAKDFVLAFLSESRKMIRSFL
jgi:hypothetical protein